MSNIDKIRNATRIKIKKIVGRSHFGNFTPNEILYISGLPFVRVEEDMKHVIRYAEKAKAKDKAVQVLLRFEVYEDA